VSADELVEAIWDGTDPPTNPRRTVQLYAARLRELFAITGQPAVIATWADGYRADVRPEQTDLGRFQWLLDEADKAAARGAPDAEASLLTRALEQWHGEPLAGVPSELLQREAVPRLSEQRLQAQERLFDAELRRGRHAEITGELIALTARYPLRERLWTQLVTALHRSGHRSEALRDYHAIQQALAAELGVAPGDELQVAHAVALAGEPAAAPVPR
jgi:DNA-binding SARP family transcriptional activator